MDVVALGLAKSDARKRYATKSRLLARRLNHLSPVLPTQLTTDAPTVTIGTAQTITGRYFGAQTGIANVFGSIGNYSTALGRLSTPGFTGLDMVLDGDAVEIRLYGQVTGNVSLLIRVDGLPVAVDPQSFATTASTTHYLKLAFGTARPRRVEIVMGPISALYGIHAAHSTIVAPPPRRPRVAFVMDSFGAGSAGTSGDQAMALTMARMLNAECISASVGGTGYVSGSDTFGGSDRVGVVAAGSPDAILICGSLNDDGKAGVQAAATAAYAAYAAACPGVPVVVLGPQPSAAATTPSAARTAVNMAIKSAALAAPNVIAFHDMIGTADGQPPDWATGAYNDGDKVVRNGSVWQVVNAGATTSTTPDTSNRWRPLTWAYTGTGRLGTTTGDGSRDFLLHSDLVHPTPAGTRALSEYAAKAFIDSLAAA